MTKNKPELLPCAHCGRTPPDPQYWRGGDQWSVKCHWDCPSNTVGNREAVVKAWNTRTPSPLMREMAEALDDCVQYIYDHCPKKLARDLTTGSASEVLARYKEMMGEE